MPFARRTFILRGRLNGKVVWSATKLATSGEYFGPKMSSIREPQMPRETVRVSLFEDVPFEAASLLRSYIAYPNAMDKTQREQYAAAWCRSGHLLRAAFDKEWAKLPQRVRPRIFIGPDKPFLKHVFKTDRTVKRRIITAYAMIPPHLEAVLLETSRSSRRPPKIGDFSTTVENFALLLKEAFGWNKGKEQDVSAFKSKMWGPTKSVAHLALMLAYHMIPLLKASADAKDDKTRIIFDANYPSNEVIERMLLEAEYIRLKLPEIKQFHIKDEDTIKFISDYG
jgi:hypothetical protein